MTDKTHADTAKKPKLVVVLGPTAVGKSDFAIQLALTHNGEIISADSRQVYLGVDLVTGAVTESEMRGIPHHLIRIRDLSSPYSVTEFVKDATDCIQDITTRGKTPILCGGTAMYIDALVYNQIFPRVPPNPKLRLELAEKSVAELYQTLLQLDPVRASTIDTQNPRRLIRAIEIATALGSVPEITHGESKYETLLIGLTMSKEILHTRIKERLDARMELGMQAEIERLHVAGNSYDYIRSFGLEFSLLPDIIESVKPREQALTELYFAIIHYAKRQRLWWKKNKDIIWLAPTEIEKADKLVDGFLKDR
ncbi:MAG: tRNA delta(2)-isopentenylpyrophosphate transferase, tRNA dimethylallyltransferase [Candidatus Parcubacteria bacterium]|jgi:tRNA dimethylallyltransferase